MDEVKRNRTERENNNKNLGIKADVDFQVLVEREQAKMNPPRPVSFQPFHHDWLIFCSIYQQIS